MGLFSKKRKVTVGVTAVRMIDKVKNPNTEAVLTSVITGKKVSETLQREALFGFFAKTENYYRYGKKATAYGLPEGYKDYSNINLEQISTVLTRIFSRNVQVQHAMVDFADDLYFARRHLQDVHKYNPFTGFMGNAPTISNPDAKVKVLSIDLDTNARKAYITCEVQMPSTDGGLTLPPKYQITVNTSYPVDDTKQYLQVKFKITDYPINDEFMYWYYDYTTDTYPELNTIIREGFDSPFYPLAPIRQNKINTNSSEGTFKKQTEKLLKTISVELDDVTDAIMSTADGNNPELVDECFVGFFANLDTTNEDTMLYLWEFFNELHDKQKVTRSNFDSWKANKDKRDTPQESITIQEKDFNITLLWNYIDINTKAGTIGKNGTATMSRTIRPRFITGGYDFEESALVISKQLSSGVVSEIVVHGLEHLVDVYEGSLYSTTLTDLDDEDRKFGFYIPINRAILRKLPMAKRSTVMMDSLTMVLYAVQITYVKWYQRGFFKLLITIVAIVIAIYFGDWSTLLSGGFTWATVTTIALNIIVNMILLEGLQLIVGMIGGELAAILAAALAVYALTSPNPSLFGLSDPKDLLQAATMTIEASNRVTMDDYNKLLFKMEDLSKSIKEKQDEIKEAYDLLGSSEIDFYSLSRGGFYFNPNELPEDFFQRSVHNKNPGTMVFEQLSYFYENALKLEAKPNWEI